MNSQQSLSDVPRRAADLRKAIIDGTQIFLSRQAELSDMRPVFWFTLGELRAAVVLNAMAADLEHAVCAAAKRLGAPGDFGYGTPCGDCLRRIYECLNALTCALRSDRPSSCSVN